MHKLHIDDDRWHLTLPPHADPESDVITYRVDSAQGEGNHYVSDLDVTGTTSYSSRNNATNDNINNATSHNENSAGKESNIANNNTLDQHRQCPQGKQ